MGVLQSLSSNQTWASVEDWLTDLTCYKITHGDTVTDGEKRRKISRRNLGVLVGWREGGVSSTSSQKEWRECAEQVDFEFDTLDGNNRKAIVSFSFIPFVLFQREKMANLLKKRSKPISKEKGHTQVDAPTDFVGNSSAGDSGVNAGGSASG